MNPPTTLPISEPDNPNIPIDQLSYEQAFAELESLIASLESDDHPLEDSIRLYERGQNLAHHCSNLLDQAELKVQQLSGESLMDFNQ